MCTSKFGNNSLVTFSLLEKCVDIFLVRGMEVKHISGKDKHDM